MRQARKRQTSARVAHGNNGLHIIAAAHIMAAGHSFFLDFRTNRLNHQKFADIRSVFVRRVDHGGFEPGANLFASY